MTNYRKFETTMSLKEDVDERLLKEETKAFWNIIFDKFDSGGELLVKALIKERFDLLEGQILSKIEEIKKHLPED